MTYDSDFQDRGRWPRGAGPRHPILVGLAMLAVAVAVGMFLLRTLTGPRGADLVEPAELAVAPPADSAAAVEARPESAATPPESAATSKVSPFRRTHPWAAPSGGRYYYPSDCRKVLTLPDLMFFRNEREAQAAGFVPASRPGC